MKPNPHKIISLVAISILASSAGHAAIVASIGTTGVFDANSNTNSIDNDPTGNLATFTSAVATAYANNLGGVIDWSTGAGDLGTSSTAPSSTLDTTVSVSYGGSATQTLTLTPTTAVGIYNNNVAGQSVALTDTTSLLPFDGGDTTIGFSLSGVDVAEIGVGMLSRTTYDIASGGVNFRATATFSDTTTSVINYNLAGSGTDTFLHFAAPSGETVTQFQVVWIADVGTGSLTDAQRRPVMDDFGFIAVPEPSVVLLSFAGLGLLLRRRR